MKCTTYRELLLLAASSDLPAEEQRQADRHLATCPTCRALTEEEHRWRAFTTAAVDRRVPESLVEAFDRRLRDALDGLDGRDRDRAPAPPRRRLWTVWAPLAAAAAVAGVLFTSLLPQSLHHDRHVEQPPALAQHHSSRDETLVVYSPDDEGTVVVWIFDEDQDPHAVFRTQ